MDRFNLAALGLRHPALTRYFIVLFIGLGLGSFFSLGQTDMPNWTIKTMVIQVQWPGATAQEMEQQVTDKIERKLQDTPWLDFVESYSVPGESFIFVQLEDGIVPPKVKVPDTWYQVRKKVSDMRHELPAGVQGPFFNDEFGDIFPRIYAVYGQDHDYAELKEQADWIRQELLLREDMVEKVTLLGVQEERIYVEFSAARLATLGIRPQEIAATLREQNDMVGAGALESSQDRLFVRVSGGFHNIEEIRAVPIAGPGGKVFRLGDIASVEPGYLDPPVFKIRYNGQAAIGLAISMRDGYSVLALANSLDRQFAELEPHLTPGVGIGLIADEPRVVANTMQVFLKKLGLAILIVLVVSYFSLGFRAGLVVATAFPLVLGITFLLMKLWPIDLQRISLGALIISLGLLVDDAIIIIEMMLVKMAQGMDRVRAATAAYSSTSFPMLTGTLISIGGFMPMALAESSMHEFMHGFYAVLGIALVVSWLVSVLFTPYIGYALLPAAPRDKALDEAAVYQTPFYRRLRAVIQTCVRRKYLVMAGLFGLILLTIAAAQRVDKQFFPLTERPELIAEVWLPEGSSFQANEEVVSKLENMLRRDAGVERWVNYIGWDSPRIFTDLNILQPAPNLNKSIIVAKNTQERRALRTRLQKFFAEELPEVRARVDHFSFGPPVGPPVQVRLLGEDPVILARIAERVRAEVEAHPDVEDVHLDWRGPARILNVQVDQERLRALGLSSGKIAADLEMSLSGVTVTQLRKGDESVNVVFRLRQEDRTATEQLPYLPIGLPDGKTISLGQVAKLHIGTEEGVRWHHNRFYSIRVRAYLPWNIQPHTVIRDLAATFEQLRSELPGGYHIEVAGNVEVNQTMDAAMAKVMPVILLAIITILMIQLQQLSLTLLVLSTAPLGLIGTVFALLLVDRPLGFVAQIGILAMAGIIMRNTVILVDQVDQDLQAGLTPWEAIVESSVRRFRPIALTGLASVLALGPLTTDPFWGPMAWSMMGGLLVATLLTVVFIPALYAIVRRVSPPVTTD